MGARHFLVLLLGYSAVVTSSSFSSDVVRPAESDMQCLKPVSSGCKAIKDRLNCLSSVDGSGTAEYKSTKQDGEPCVWCGGGLCTTDDDAKCAPYDFLAKGEGVAYTTLHAMPSYMTVATCQADRNADFDNLQCLTSSAQGCNSIQDEGTCLSSSDGRPYEYIAGYKVKGQPCVWCGGGYCDSQNTNKCEPYDYAVNGAGHAFDTFHAFGVFKAAACQSGEPASHILNSGFNTHGTSWQVQCGAGPPQVWTKVGRVCGECKAYVSMIGELYKTCSDYCAVQPSDDEKKKCVNGHTVQEYSCDTIKEVGCDYEFSESENAQCECEGASTEAATPAPQTFASASCSAFPRCQQLGLDGDCCPNGAGAVLGCCTEQALAAADTGSGLSDSLVAGDKAADAAQDANKSPAEQAQAAAAAAGNVAEDSGANAALAAGLAAGTAAGAAGLSPVAAGDAVDSTQGEPTNAVVAAAAAASAAGVAGGLTSEQAEAAGTQVGQTAGVAAGLSAATAAEAAAQAAQMAQDAEKTVGATVSEAATPVTAEEPPPSPTGALQNAGLDCWKPCNEKTGLCTYCGRGNACCNRNSVNPPKECQNITYFVSWHHECVSSVHQVDSSPTEAFSEAKSAGAAAAADAKGAGKSAQDQAQAAAFAAGKSAMDSGMTTFQATQAATEAAAQAAEDAGISADAAKSAGIVVAGTAAANGFDADAMIASGNGQTEEAEDLEASETVKAAAAPSDSFSAGQYVMMCLAVLAIIFAGCAGYYLSGQGAKAIVTRDADIAIPVPVSQDLEYQAPLVTNGAVQYYQPAYTVPARQVAGQSFLSSVFAQKYTEMFDAADAPSHDNVLTRDEFNAAVASGIIR